MRSDFGPINQRVPNRVKSLQIVLVIYEDDVPEVPEIPEVVAVEAVERVEVVPAVAAVDEVLDDDGNVVTETVPAVAAVAPVAGVVGVKGVPAVPAVPAHVQTSENNTFDYQILDEDGEVMETRQGDIEDALPKALQGKASAILAALFAQAKAGITGS